ncbi:MBL fold metallo-hydrolase [Salirhabdus salicampi]|uniref:MBL fold metallo-hydrolase n=1 Tax=Salirhabdus salicampi TaxID=476102 RepID=UPI0020C27C9D|nr:MBL fold metallo-hydrolase [Salirhabdus salicampi]MCP8616854.1 MBL fold metallo-hydrolase [Salirhabdus salicampi]
MEWKRMPLGLVETNCYVLQKGKEALIVDPGGDEEKIVSYIKQEELKPLAILLTHAHFDHIGAVDVVRDTFHIPMYVSKVESEWLGDPQLNGSQFFSLPPVVVKEADHFIEEGPHTIGPFAIRVVSTPGHSPGSLSFCFDEEGIVVSGDTLFHGSIGRTDLPGGDYEQLIDSITTQLLSLPAKTKVLPGHGPETTIEQEKETNPFL